MKYRHLIYICIFLLICLAVYLFFYNYNFYQENLEYRQNVEEIKKQISESNQRFVEEQQKKVQEVTSNQKAINSQDKDGDGLTYEEELRLRTDDNNKDSDGDGVNDKEDMHPAGGDTTYTKTVHWVHDKKEYTTQFGVPEDWYLYYKNKERTEHGIEYVTYDNPIIRNIVEDVMDSVKLKGDNPNKAIIDFVQSIVYQYDIDYNKNPDYPKYVIETLIDERGDCEDTAYLMAAFFKAAGVEVKLVDLPRHMATAIVCSDCSGYHYNYNGKSFYYLETTGYGWEPGEVPNEFRNAQAILIDV
ncbi:MAG: transglutaminase-like domain-containing protein [Nanoarchaeota archaeon]|nr:transglutaminase-like domain-containing protein [Nanoarchaeota archaeon]